MITAPAWLIERGGALKLGSDGATWFVIFNHQPDYSLAVVPVCGQYGVTLRQTVNGNRFDVPASFPSPDAALNGGLSELRKFLGWGE